MIREAAPRGTVDLGCYSHVNSLWCSDSLGLSLPATGLRELGKRNLLARSSQDSEAPGAPGCSGKRCVVSLRAWVGSSRQASWILALEKGGWGVGAEKELLVQMSSSPNPARE